MTKRDSMGIWDIVPVSLLRMRWSQLILSGLPNRKPWHCWYDVGMRETEGRGLEDEFQGSPWEVVEGELFGQRSVVMSVS